MKITKKPKTKPWTDKVNIGIETFDFFLLALMMGLRGMVSVGLYLKIVRIMDEAPCRSENIDVFGDDFLFCLQSLLPQASNSDRKW